MRTEAQALNPWISMWTKPRATIRQIVAADPRRLVLALAAIVGISEGLDASARHLARETLDVAAFYSIALIVAGIGAIFSMIGLYISAAFIRWTGVWIGGRASKVSIRAAIAWSFVPIIWVAPLSFLTVVLFATVGQVSGDGASPLLGFSRAFFVGVAGVAGVTGFVAELWSFVLLLKSLGEVQGFSAWKALGNLMLSALLFLIVIVVVSFVVYLVYLVIERV
ncbi:MAG: YIP1 family protein [Gammaproteobacteria bacterium]|nr:YIP1 family protein [Gammaproteobacteria bacterium]